jgi:Domain of unknown function (DUF4333)
MSQQAPPPPAGPFPGQPLPGQGQYGQPGPAGYPYGSGGGGYPPPQQPQPPRKSKVGKVIGIVVGVFVALIVAIFVLVMVFGNPTVSAEQVEAQIAQQYGVDVSQVSCPGSLEGTVGATMTCTGTDAGTSSPLLVQVTGVDGDTVNFSITPQ